MFKKRLFTGLLVFAIAFGTMLPGVRVQAAQAVTAEFGQAPKVTGRSQQDISNYLKARGVSREALKGKVVTFGQSPVYKAPFNQMGSISNVARNDAFNIVNSIRYIAGLDEITIDNGMEYRAQAASMVNAAGRQLSHTPAKPAGMADDLYKVGYDAAGSSNLARGGNMLNDFWSNIVEGWLGDSDSNNIKDLGHRRWLLNPSMGKTGFGMVITPGDGTYGYWAYASMVVTDLSNSGASQSLVAWPAQNTPTDFMQAEDAWSISVGKNVDASSARITLKSRNTGKTWTFQNGTRDGDYYVNTKNYGTQGTCLIFRPNGISAYNAGDVFDVSITGLPIEDINYTVTFFNAAAPASNPTAVADAAREAALNNSVGPQGTVYRLVNLSDGERLYTTDRNERRHNVLTGEWGEEPSIGISSGNLAIYRLYNTKNGQHLYSSDIREINVRVAEGWIYDNQGKPLFYGSTTGSKPIYRLYNPHAGTVKASHRYTGTATEINQLLSEGWLYDNAGRPMYFLN